MKARGLLGVFENGVEHLDEAVVGNQPHIQELPQENQQVFAPVWVEELEVDSQLGQHLLNDQFRKAWGVLGHKANKNGVEIRLEECDGSTFKGIREFKKNHETR